MILRTSICFFKISTNIESKILAISKLTDFFFEFIAYKAPSHSEYRGTGLSVKIGELVHHAKVELVYLKLFEEILKKYEIDFLDQIEK